MDAAVCMSDSETSCTSDRSRVRKLEGKADGFDVVTITFDDVSTYVMSKVNWHEQSRDEHVPLFRVPHKSQTMWVWRLVLASSRFPQSVQKTSEPIAAMTVPKDPHSREEGAV